MKEEVLKFWAWLNRSKLSMEKKLIVKGWF